MIECYQPVLILNLLGFNLQYYLHTSTYQSRTLLDSLSRTERQLVVEQVEESNDSPINLTAEILDLSL